METKRRLSNGQNGRKDVIPGGWLWKAKNVIFSVSLGIIIMSTLTNMANQVYTLVKAAKETAALEERIGILEKEEKRLTDLVKAASESGYTEGLKRELLGVGSSGDYWVIMPEEEELVEVYPEAKQAEEVTNLKLWFQMFTD